MIRFDDDCERRRPMILIYRQPPVCCKEIYKSQFHKKEHSHALFKKVRKNTPEASNTIIGPVAMSV